MWRLVVEGGIEEKVLEIQEKKRRIAAEAFREDDSARRPVKTRRSAKLDRMADLGVLLGSGAGKSAAKPGASEPSAVLEVAEI